MKKVICLIAFIATFACACMAQSKDRTCTEKSTTTKECVRGGGGVDTKVGGIGGGFEKCKETATREKTCTDKGSGGNDKGTSGRGSSSSDSKGSDREGGRRW